MDFVRQVDLLIKGNKEGSFGTHNNRREFLHEWAKSLPKGLRLENLKQKHIQYSIDKWQKENIATGTIKNRLSYLRWLANKADKPKLIPKTNRELGIENRRYSDNSINKAKEIDSEKLSKLSERQQASIELQRAFGLRREESLKFTPSYADKGDKIQLKASWCKGGRAREIPIRTEQQRELLNKCHDIAKKGSMIAKNQSYIQARESLDKATQRANIKNMHGFRHKYAQERYLELTSRQCPKNGGKVSQELNKSEKIKDNEARLIISRELGHNREIITVNYLGR